MRRVSLRERPNWRAEAEAAGFTYHTGPQGPYWDERAAYAFTLEEIERDIEAPVDALEQLCLAFVEKAVADEAILKSLAIPPFAWDAIAASWTRGDRNLYGRFDIAYDGRGPFKLLEYNADTPTALMETGWFQWSWLEEQMAAGLLPKGADQFNSVHDKLVAALRRIKGGAPYFLHLTCLSDAEEDMATVAYLAECAAQAKLPARILPIDQIGLDDQGRFVDENNKPIETLFKLYPWEWMLADPFGQMVPKCQTQFIEPLWKAVLSNKGLLPHLHAMEPGHPNLLPAYFAGDPAASALGDRYVRKPLLSREGANIERVEGVGHATTQGPYGGEGHIVQALADIPNLGGGYAIIGAWVVASEPAGMCLREDDGPVTTNLARFVPHYIEP